MACLQEDCANWNGHGCPCEVLDVEPVDVRAQAAEWDGERPACSHPVDAVIVSANGDHLCASCDLEWWEDPL